MRRHLAPLLVLASACVVEAHPRPPPPRLLSAQEAVDIGTQFARSRGLAVEYTNRVRLDRRARWHVDLGGAGGRDRAILLLDGYSGQVLAARLRGPRGEIAPEPQPPGPGGPPLAPPPEDEPSPRQAEPPPPAPPPAR